MMAMALQSTCARVHSSLQGSVYLDGRSQCVSVGTLKPASASTFFAPLNFVFARAVSVPISGKKSSQRGRRISCFGNPTLESAESKDSGDFVEVGYIAGTHGVHGELRVYSVTDFPEERFEKPGIRWLRSKTMGKPVYQEVELVEGREVGGKRPSWLITLKGFNSVEKAGDLVGSTLLVTERPSLDDDEFYIPDLIGMAVILQESGQEIGVILDVYNTGGDSDLLRVRRTDGTSGQKVWIPFVKEIVPVVDKDQRRVVINPPAGLLELNSRVGSKDEKVRRKKASINPRNSLQTSQDAKVVSNERKPMHSER